ncbi:MAG: Maf family protein [Burkholderiales bacterium]|jgi:septum formation protein
MNPAQPHPSSTFIWLASQSPRRQDLLTQIGVRFELLLADAHEDAEALEALRPGESPTQYVTRVVQDKARAALQRHARRGLHAAPILVADTTVALGGSILGKPANADDASRMLSQLSGRTHRVLTSIALCHPSKDRIDQRTQVSRVAFARLRPDWIRRYIAGGEPFGKAGSYAIQGAAASMIRRIEGSHSGIMGLPLYETALLLRRAGILTGPCA